MEQTLLDGVNIVMAHVNETIQAAKEQNDSVVGQSSSMKITTK